MGIIAVSGVCLIILLVTLSIAEIIPGAVAAWGGMFTIISLGLIAYIKKRVGR